ncbi:MAG: tetratricopeptide repeat protein [Parahaliea sp.]
MTRVRFDTETLSEAMSQWRTKRRLAQEMQSLFPHKYTNAETPYRALRRAETGEFVDLGTARCIATALKTPLDSLLETPLSGAVKQPESPPPAPASAGATGTPVAAQVPAGMPRHRRWLPLTALLVMLFTVAGLALLLLITADLSHASMKGAGTKELNNIASTPSRRIGLLSEGAVEAPLEELEQKFADHLPKTGLNTVAGIERLPQESVLQLPARFDADGVAQLVARDRGRYLEVALFYATHSSLNHLWTEALPRNELPTALDALAQHLANALAGHLGLHRIPGDTRLGSAQPRAFDAYLRARILLDGSEASSLATLSRVSSLLQSALQRDPQLSLAQAAQCISLASLFWVNDHRPYLRDAHDACERAAALAPDHPYVAAAQGVLDTRDGRAESAIARLTAALQQHTGNTALHLALAQAQFARFERAGDDAALERAIVQMDIAISLEPDYWSPHFWHGTYAYYQRDFPTALASLQRAVKLHPAAITLTNLGTIALCRDNLTLAQRSFEDIERRFPANHLGPETLAAIYHFSGDYAREVAYREKGLRLMGDAASPDIFQVYGALGDAYRLLGDDQQALDNYRRALSIIQRDSSRQIARTQDGVALALYRLRIAALEHSPSSSDAAKEAAAEQLDRTTVEGTQTAPEHVWTAVLAGLLDRPDLADRHWAAAIASCPVYRRHPDNPLDSRQQ